MRPGRTTVKKATVLGVLAAICFSGTVVLYGWSMDRPAFRPGEPPVVRSIASDLFETIQYHEATQTLMLVFREGYAYEYVGVPRACFEGLASTRAKGVFFNEQIRGQFPCRRIDAD